MQTLMTDKEEIDIARDNIATNVRDLMSARSMTQQELATEADISQGFVSKILRGTLLPNGLLLHKIARALDTTSEKLLDIPRRKAS
jgi:transcriptional regulator with XRE-family HTH domain